MCIFLYKPDIDQQASCSTLSFSRSSRPTKQAQAAPQPSPAVQGHDQDTPPAQGQSIMLRRALRLLEKVRNRPDSLAALKFSALLRRQTSRFSQKKRAEMRSHVPPLSSAASPSRKTKRPSSLKQSKTMSWSRSMRGRQFSRSEPDLIKPHRPSRIASDNLDLRRSLSFTCKSETKPAAGWKTKTNRGRPVCPKSSPSLTTLFSQLRSPSRISLLTDQSSKNAKTRSSTTPTDLRSALSTSRTRKLSASPSQPKRKVRFQVTHLPPKAFHRNCRSHLSRARNPLRPRLTDAYASCAPLSKKANPSMARQLTSSRFTDPKHLMTSTWPENITVLDPPATTPPRRHQHRRPRETPLHLPQGEEQQDKRLWLLHGPQRDSRATRRGQHHRVTASARPREQVHRRFLFVDFGQTEDRRRSGRRVYPPPRPELRQHAAGNDGGDRRGEAGNGEASVVAGEM
ncbi:hypothetical protein MPH_13094 [Macrophomina phaseolina MS6]|uniref:Uncharacterized protein n=1 Tax=Macrophomina phaseolina (strain MS6) TaxID=1126212 RepID=K2RAH1_MACPH|nr:hypothetical protein MPH_13094 [Macrophomina phaseolina MS6]